MSLASSSGCCDLELYELILSKAVNYVSNECPLPSRRPTCTIPSWNKVEVMQVLQYQPGELDPDCAVRFVHFFFPPPKISPFLGKSNE